MVTKYTAQWGISSVQVGITPTPQHKNVVKIVPTQTVAPAPFKPNIGYPDCYRHMGWSHGWHGAEFEYGADYDCGYHTPAVALWSGRVYRAYRTCWNPNCSSSSGGVVIVVAVVPGYGTQSTYYLHLDTVSVKEGEYIDKGTVVGLTGGQVGYGFWPTSPQYTSGPHIEIGSCAIFLPCPVGYNFNPEWAIANAL